jgi:hypothetical protein
LEKSLFDFGKDADIFLDGQTVDIPNHELTVRPIPPVWSKQIYVDAAVHGMNQFASRFQQQIHELRIRSEKHLWDPIEPQNGPERAFSNLCTNLPAQRLGEKRNQR